MRLFFEICLKSFQRHLVYRAATLAGLVTNLFFGMLRASVLVALYGSRTMVNGLSVQDAIAYAGLTQAIIGFISLFSWYELSNSVYTGSVSMDLVKPLGYYQFWLAQDLGRALVQLFLRGLPLMLIYGLVYNISLPSTLIQWLALTATLILAWMISFSWRFLLNLTSFWVVNATGILRLGFVISWFLSGFIMPLRYFPDWFVSLCNLTPFPHIINSVSEIFLGVVQGPEIVHVLILQLIWAIGLIILGHLVLRAGIRRLVIQGG